MCGLRILFCIIAVLSGLSTSHAALKIKPALDYYEFVAGRSFAKSERRTLIRLVRTAERENPDQTAASVREFSKQLTQLAKIKKPLRKTLIRDTAAAHIYCRLRDDVDPDAATYLNILFHTNEVHASNCTDVENPIVASRRSLFWIERILRFSTSRRFDKAERRQVRASIVKQAQDFPEFTLSALGTIMSGWNDIIRHNRVKHAIAQQKSIAPFYCSVFQSSGQAQVDFWFRNDKILAANCDTKMVVSRSKARAFLGIYNFVRHFGGKRQATKAESRKFYESIRQTGANLELTQGLGNYLNNAIAANTVLKLHWTRLSGSDRDRMRNQFRKRLNNGEHPVDIAFDINRLTSSTCRRGENVYCVKPTSYLQLLSDTINLPGLFQIVWSNF